MSRLSFQDALVLTANFAFTAERMRAADAEFQTRANICETASRVAFLKAHQLAKSEESRPAFGEARRRAVYASA